MQPLFTVKEKGEHYQFITRQIEIPGLTKRRQTMGELQQKHRCQESQAGHEHYACPVKNKVGREQEERRRSTYGTKHDAHTHQ